MSDSDPGGPNPHISPPASASSVTTLVCNVMLPGLGTIIAGQTGVGVAQLALFLVGIPLIFLFGIGLFVMAGAWIWGVILGWKMMAASTSPGAPSSGGPDFH